MKLLEAITERRSIRAYRKDPIPDDVMKQILTAAMAAPSAGNLQARHFYIVRDPSLKKDLASAALNQSFIAEAPVVVVVCTDNRIRSEYGERGVSLYSIMDCAASIQNMLLAAHSLGIGTCWVGAFDERRVSKVLNAPARFRPVAIIPHGHSAESPMPPSRVTLEEACEFI